MAAIAELAGVKVSEVRAVVKTAGAQLVQPPDALGAASAAPNTAGSGPADQSMVALPGDAARAAGVGVPA
jgi:hypothetical protein